MPSFFTTVVGVLLTLVTGTQASNTDLSAFVGTWRENQSKSRRAIPSVATYTFTAEADGFLTVERGGVPLRDRVRFDGADYPTPGIQGRTASWRKVTETIYESTIKRNGALVATGRWTLSEGGAHLTQETTPVRANGEADISIMEYVRVSGDATSLLGVWKPVSSRSAAPDLFTMTLSGNELYAFYPKYGGVVYSVRLDGKPYALSGPNAFPDSTTAAQAVSLRSFRRTTFQGGKPTLEILMTVSSDGETMTVTTHVPESVDPSSVFVYERQR